MIQKLRRKFIIILMAVVTLILLAVFVSLLIASWNGSRNMSNGILRQALSMQPRPERMMPPQMYEQRGEPFGARSPILVAEIGPDGAISLPINQLHFVDETQAKALIMTVMNRPEASGVLREAGLRWLKSTNKTRVALADISMEQEMLNNLVVSALSIGAAALIVFFFVSVLLSRWAVRPVEIAWERQRQFVADASHEIKTPLTVILSNAELLRGAADDRETKQARRLEHIAVEAARMKRLVEDLLLLAKTDSMENRPVKERFDFSFCVKSAALAFESVVYDEHKQLSVAVSDNLFVAGDAQRLQQLVGILLDNAVKYCSVGGRIDVSLRETDKKTVELSVYSDGTPIPKRELTLIFERFYRVDKARSDDSSFGLGLSIAAGIVDENGGKIWAVGGAQQGNTFFVNLPAAK